MTVLQVFFSNLIFALTARTLSGNRLNFFNSYTQAKEAHMAGAYPGFCSTKQLRVLQGYPKKYVAGTHFKDLDEARQNGVKFLYKETTQ